jgi:hypothetical protein
MPQKTPPTAAVARYTNGAEGRRLIAALPSGSVSATTAEQRDGVGQRVDHTERRA